MPEHPTQQPVLYRIPSALVVPALGAAGYALAHAFESAYLAYFGLPDSLVRVSINSVIVATGSLLSVVVTAFYLTFAVASGLRNEKGEYGGKPEVLAALLVFVVFVLDTLFMPSWKVRLGYMSAIAVSALVIGRAARNWRERASQRTAPSSSFGNPVNPLLPWIGWDLVLFTGLLFAAHGMASLVGSAHARRETRFLTLNDPSGFVVLRVYDDSVIAVSLDRTNHSVGPDIKILRPEGLAAKREVLGPLKHSTSGDTGAVTR